MNEQPGRSDKALAPGARGIDLAHHGDFLLGPVRVRPSLRRIEGPDGSQMLEPKVMQVLIALSDPVGTLLSRDDLIERCWDGRAIGDTSINRVISLLRGALREVAGEAVRVENVPKVGYRLVARPFDDKEQTAASERSDGELAPPGGPVHPAASRRGAIAGALALAGLALAAIVLSLRPFDSARIPEMQLAILPLEVADGVDPIYAAGLESELRAEFARVGKMQVTASESARLLVAEGLSPAEIGKRLGVPYVWSGRFAVEAEKASLDLKLIDVATAKQIHTDRLTSAPGAAQHIPYRTARSVSIALGRPVGESMVPASVSDGDFRLLLTAKGLLRSRGVEQHKAAFEILGEVTRRNPDFAAAIGTFAKAHFLFPTSSMETAKDNRDRAVELARRALELEPDTIEALKVIGITARNDPATALGNLDRAAALDPGDSEALFWLGTVQRQFVLEGGDPLATARKMVEIDPLWPASWNASKLAAESGRLDLARQIERDILAAAITPSQTLFAQARMARLEGDLSGFMAKAQRAARTSTDAERRWSLWLEDRSTRILLDLPVAETPSVPRDGTPLDIMRGVDRMELPARSRLEAAGLTGKSVWKASQFMAAAAPLYLQYDRHGELIADYDARFSSPGDFARFVEGTGNAVSFHAAIGPALVMALRRVGRSSEAETHLRALQTAHARMAEAAPQWLDTLLFGIDIAALGNENARAAEMVARLPEFGWPHAISRIDPTVLGLLRGDPLYDDIRELPEVRAVLGPIRQRLSQERAEVLSLDL